MKNTSEDIWDGAWEPVEKQAWDLLGGQARYKVWELIQEGIGYHTWDQVNMPRVVVWEEGRVEEDF
jgi:hypothetical protein